MIRFSSVLGNSQKLDGGAMFGNAPKALWSRWVKTDERNRIDLACRALLVETENHKILLESGIGAYMEPKYRDRFGVQESEHILLASLDNLGLNHEDIDIVILSHLHFDHAGGLLSAYEDGKEPQLLFPHATYYVGQEAWQRAQNPHPRDRASFIPSLNEQLARSGRLKTINQTDVLHFDDLEVHFIISEGHTPGMLCSDLRWQGGRMVFAADMIPGRPWVHLPITMGYDRFPERLIDEKRSLLSDLAAQNAWLYFTHDSEVAAARVTHDPAKDRFGVGESLEQMERQTWSAE